MKRIPKPEESEWEEVWYHPSDIVTRYSGGNYWQETIPGCRIEVVEEDLGFMRHLVQGVKIKVIYPPEWKEMYVQPLAKIHNIFFDCMSEVIYFVYPFNNKNMKKFRLGGKIHSFVSRFYWEELNYKNFNPKSWVEKLNSILIFVENNPIKSEDEMSNFENKFRKEF